MDRIFNNGKLTKQSQNFRSHPTDEEGKLWDEFLSTFPYKFRRQKVIGRYIVDFYCAKKRIAIEIDGLQHFEEKGMIHDEERTEFLRQCNVEVIRYSNLDINQRFTAVCEDIMQKFGLMD